MFLFLTRFGTFGVVFEYGCEKKVSQFSVLGATMTVGTPMGVSLKIRWVSPGDLSVDVMSV